VGAACVAVAALGLAIALTTAGEPAVAVKAANADPSLEHTMFGGTPDRNFVNRTGKFNAVQLMPVKEGEEVKKEADATVKWKQQLGSRAYGGPIVSGGKVFVGTNNEHPRNPRDSRKNADGEVEPIDRGNLMCFEEATGKFLWQAVFDKLPSGQVHDWPKEGICSTPLVEGNRLYLASNRCTIVCIDTNGLADGNQGVTTEKYKTETDADILWEFDMMKELGVFPHNMTSSSPLVVGDILYVSTANGVDEDHLNIPSPQAPSFLALDKNTGKVVWKRADPGRNIMHGQWSNPCYGEINGVRQVIFPGGDGWLYGLKPETGDLLWKFDANPKDAKYELGGSGTKNDFISTPVVWEGKVYIGVGQDPEHFSGVGHFWCFDPAKATKPGQDISPELVDRVEKDADGKDKVIGKPNPESAVVWHYGGPDKRPFVLRDYLFGRTMCTATVVDGIVYVGDLQGYVHCLDAKTGKKYWQYDLKGGIWGSTYYVDGKVFLANEHGDLFAFKHEKTPEVIDEIDIPDAKDRKDFRAKMEAKRAQFEKKYLLGKCEFDAALRSTPVVANGVMYVMSERTLFAMEPKKK
jgi:outer membrane protein assembly factor BamB